MKKLMVYISTFLLLLSLTACNAKGSNNAENSGNTDQSIVTYTKEFSYFPTYRNLELQSIIQPSEKDQLVTARYLIKNTTTNTVLNEYAEILKTEGWTLNWTYTKDKTPSSIMAQKDKHMAVLLPHQTGDNVLLDIGSK